MFQPRPYQIDCINSIWNYFQQRIESNSSGVGSPVAALPTGVGKSVLPAIFMKQAMEQYPGQRMLMLTHVKELVEQNHKALKRIWPVAPVGIYSAGLKRKESYAPIVYGSIQTIKNAIPKIGRRDMLFIDEAHLLSPNDNSMYQQVIAELRRYNPLMPVIGLSATPFRMGQGYLNQATRYGDKMVEPIFTDICYDLTGVQAFTNLIHQCYLSPLIPKRVDNVIDVSDVRELNNDFVQTDLVQAIIKQHVIERALVEACDLARDRRSWVVFGAGIENCEEITTRLNSMGVTACYVHSKMSNEQRDQNIAAFKSGAYRAIVSNNVLTTGFDHPQTDCIIDLRPTISVVLHIQKYGRGTRPYFHPTFTQDQLQHLEYRRQAMEMGGKKNCLVLDFAGNTARLGPINDPQVPKPKGSSSGEVPVKICPMCGTYNHTVARFCENTDCNFEFVFRSKLKPNASTEEIIKGLNPDANISIVHVDSMAGYLHTKDNKPPKLRVQYFSGMQLFQSFFGFDKSDKNFVRHKAHEWWRQHSPNPVPESTEEAVKRFGECRKTATLRVNMANRYPEILEYLF